MSATISHLFNKPNTDKKIGFRPIFYSPLPVTLPAKIGFLNLTETTLKQGKKMPGQWLKSMGIMLGVAGVLAAGTLFFAGRQAEAAATFSAMAELSGSHITNPGDLQITFAAMAQAAGQDVAVRQARIQNLIAADSLTGWQHLAASLANYMSYGLMSDQEALALERQQLALAQDAVDRYEVASTRQATHSTRDFARN